MIGCEQTIEGQETCQQRAEPEDGGPKPRQQCQVGPDGKRHQHHDGEKEQYADQGAAADAKRDPDVPADQGTQRGHETSPTWSVRAGTPKGVWVAATIRPPRAK